MIYVITALISLVVGLIVGYLAGSMSNDVRDALALMSSKITDIKHTADTIANNSYKELAKQDELHVEYQEQKVEKKYRTQPVKKVESFPEEDLISDTQIEQMLYDTYPKEMIAEFLALSDVEKQQVINEFKSQRNGNSQSIPSETG